MNIVRKALKEAFECGQSDDGYYVAKSKYSEIEDKRMIGRINRIIRRSNRQITGKINGKKRR